MQGEIAVTSGASQKGQQIGEIGFAVLLEQLKVFASSRHGRPIMGIEHAGRSSWARSDAASYFEAIPFKLPSTAWHEAHRRAKYA